MSDDEKLINKAAAQVGATGDRPVTIETKLTTVFDLIAMVQVALRHPGVRGTGPAQRSEKFLRALIEQIDPDHGDVWRLLSFGFDPDHDV